MTDSNGPAAPRRGWRPMVASAAAGVAVFAAVMAAQWADLLTGWVLIGFGLLVALAIPSSRETSRRIFFLGCIVLGWAPLLWAFPFQIEGVSHIGVVTAALAGTLCSLLLLRRIPVRALLPRFRVTDGLTLAAAAFSTWTVWPLLSLAKGEAALRVLRLGWDYAAHFNMVEMIRRVGSLVELASPGPFGSWAYSGYPKGFHAVAATMMDATVGREIGSHEAELLGFVQATAVLSVAAVTMVVAGLATLPQTRRHPLLAVPLMALVTLALTWGPGGGSLLHYGFPNFFLATAQLACIPLIVIPLVRLGQTTPMLALSGSLVGIAHNWALLLAMAFAGLIAALVPLRAARWPCSVGGRVRLAAIAVATVLGGAAAWSTLAENSSPGGAGSLLTIGGGFVGGSRIEMLLPPLVAIMIGVTLWWAFARRRDRPADGTVTRTAALMLLPLTGLAVLAGVAALQLIETGGLGYYFFKLGAGLQLASVVLIAASFAVLVPLAKKAPARRKLLLAGSGIAMAPLLAISSGFVNPTSEALAVRRPPGLDARVAWEQAQSSPSSREEADARDVLLAAGVVDSDTRHFWVPATLDGSTAPRLSNQWLFALTGQWSDSSYRVVDELWGDAVPVDERPRWPDEAIRGIAEAAPDAVVVVPPALRDRLASDSSLNGIRITSW